MSVTSQLLVLQVSCSTLLSYRDCEEMYLTRGRSRVFVKEGFEFACMSISLFFFFFFFFFFEKIISIVRASLQ